MNTTKHLPTHASRSLVTTLILLIGMAMSTFIARAAESPTVSFRAVFFDPRDAEIPQFFITHGGARTLLEIDKSSISGVQKALVRDGGLVDFFASKSPKEGELPLATLTLPAERQGQLMVFLAPSGTSFRAWATLLSRDQFGPGATIAINTSPQQVAVRVGETPAIIILPGKSGLLPLPKNYKEAMISVQIFSRSETSDPWKIAQSTRWATDQRFRSYIFFYSSPTSKRLMLHGITERLDDAGP